MTDNIVINVTENPHVVQITTGDPYDARYIDLGNLPFYGNFVDGDKLVVRRLSDGLNYYLRPVDIRNYLKDRFPYFTVTPSTGDILQYDESDDEWYPANIQYLMSIGWIKSAYQWTRISDYAFTLNANLSTKPEWRPGSRVRFYGAPSYTYKQGVIHHIDYASPTSTVYLVENSLYLMDASPSYGATANTFRPSYVDDEFPWSPAISFVGGTTDPTFYTTTRAAWRNVGTRFTFDIEALIQTGGVGDRDTTIFSLPTPLFVNTYKPASVIVSGLTGTGDHVVPAYFDDDLLYIRHGSMTMDGAIFVTGSFSI